MQFPRLTIGFSHEKELTQLREENARLKAGSGLSWFVDHPVPGFIVSVKSRKILDVNHAGLRQYRYERKELLDQNLEVLRAAGSGSFSRQDVESTFQNKLGCTVKQQRRDGTVFAAEMIVHPIQYQDTVAEFVQVWDVSRRVDAELTQRSIQRRYLWLMEHATESLWRFELEVPIPVSLPIDEQVERCYRFACIAEASTSTARFYGYKSANTMIGMRLEEFMPRNKSNDQFLRNFIRSGYKLLDAETQEKDAQGNPKWFINRLIGEVEGGLFVRAWGASLDISDRKQVEASHKQSDQLWRDALENVQLLTLFLDHHGQVTYVNPYFCRITGWLKEGVLGQPFYQCFHADHTSHTAEYVKQLISGSIRNYATNNFQTRDGRTLLIDWNNTIIHDATGQPIGVFSIGDDVTERHRTNVALQESEDRYRRLVDGLPLGLYRSTPEGQLTFCNPVVLNLLGLNSIEEASRVNLNDNDYGPSYSRKEFRARMETEGGGYGMEFSWTKRDGTKLWVREHARAIRDEHGHVSCYEGTLEDITTEKFATQAIQEREEQYRMLSQLAPIGIFMTCQDIVVHANQYLATMLGYETPADMEGKKLLELLHPTEREEVQDQYLNGPVTYGLLPLQERRILKKDGSALLVQAHVARVRVNNERGSVIVVRDISEERQAENERRRWQQRILEMQKLESLGLLAGGLAHDFNNQLTVILGHTSLVKVKLENDEAMQGLVLPIEQAARHSMDLCQQMLSFAGRGKIQVHQVNLTQLIQESAGLLKIACAKKAQLHFELSEALPLLQAEEAQLRQVLINLVSNSADSIFSGQLGAITIKTGLIHTDETYKNVEVTLELSKGEYVYLDVTDNGSGMDVNTRRRIFEPFFTTKPTGRGLGLPAVLGIVRSHGGAIEVSSKLRQGTTFRVFLPVKRPMQSDPLSANTEETAVRQTILVVDDEASLRSLTSRVLRNHGWNVIEAEDGLAACELLRQHGETVSLALIDLIMPGMDGVETLRQLWMLQPTLPAIAMSSYGSEELEQRFTGFPLRGILTKPFTPTSLEQAVIHVLGTIR